MLEKLEFIGRILSFTFHLVKYLTCAVLVTVMIHVFFDNNTKIHVTVSLVIAFLGFILTLANSSWVPREQTNSGRSDGDIKTEYRIFGDMPPLIMNLVNSSFIGIPILLGIWM